MKDAPGFTYCSLLHGVPSHAAQSVKVMCLMAYNGLVNSAGQHNVQWVERQVGSFELGNDTKQVFLGHRR